MIRRSAIVAVVAALALAAIALALWPRDDEGPAAATRAHAVAGGFDGTPVAAVERLEDGRWRSALARVESHEPLEPFGDPLPLERPAALARQADGKLLVAGERRAGDRRVLAVARVDRDGRVDRSFGRGGVTTVAAGDGDAVARGVAVEQDRGIVLVGDATFGGRPGIAFARIGGDGRGSRVTPIRGATAAGAATAPDGRALVGGTDARDGRALLARLRPGRPPLVTRAGNRKLRSTTWRAIVAAPDGGAVLVGSGRDDSARSLVATQAFDPAGDPGRATATAAGDGDAHGTAAAVQDDRVVVGATGVEAAAPAAFTVTLGVRPAASRRGPGRAVGITSGGGLLVTRWDGARQNAAYLAR